MLWEVANGKKLRTFQGHTDWVMGVAVSGNGKHVLTGSGDKTAVLWDGPAARNSRRSRGTPTRSGAWP